MLSKVWIQFSVDWWDCVPSLLFDLRQSYGGGNEDNGYLLQKVPPTHCCTQCPQPCSRPPLTHASTRETPGHSRASLGPSLVGSLLLSPGSWCTQVFVCALQESVSPVLCKFWWLYGGINGDLLQEGLCHSRSTAPGAPAPAAVHCWPIPLQETLKQNSGSVSVGSLGPGVHKVCLSTLSVSGRYGVHQKATKIKCWRVCAGKGTLLHSWWGCKLVQSLWRTIWRFLKKLKM